MRVALSDAAPFYRDAPEAHELRLSSRRIIDDFLREVLPLAAPDVRTLAVDILMMSLSAAGKYLSEAGKTPEETDIRSGAVGEMLCAYLERLGAKGPAWSAAV